MSALRNWIVTNLKNLLPSAPMTIWSDTNGSQFQQLTGLTQEELMTKWYGPKDSSGNRSGTGTDPTFTTCTSFLPIFASKVCSAGGLAGKQLRPFKLNTENGWVANADGASPEAGDFFLLGTAVHLEHVGVILLISLLGFAGALILPPNLIRLLGIIPMGLGLYHLFRKRHDDDDPYQ